MVVLFHNNYAQVMLTSLTAIGTTGPSCVNSCKTLHYDLAIAIILLLLIVLSLYLALLSTSNHSGAGRYSREVSYITDSLTSFKSVFFTLISSLNHSMLTFLFPCCEAKTAKGIA